MPFSTHLVTSWFNSFYFNGILFESTLLVLAKVMLISDNDLDQVVYILIGT
jgi:hypothetical protein